MGEGQLETQCDADPENPERWEGTGAFDTSCDFSSCLGCIPDWERLPVELRQSGLKLRSCH